MTKTKSPAGPPPSTSGQSDPFWGYGGPPQMCASRNRTQMLAPQWHDSQEIWSFVVRLASTFSQPRLISLEILQCSQRMAAGVSSAMAAIPSDQGAFTSNDLRVCHMFFSLSVSRTSETYSNGVTMSGDLGHSVKANVMYSLVWFEGAFVEQRLPLISNGWRNNNHYAQNSSISAIPVKVN